MWKGSIYHFHISHNIACLAAPPPPPPLKKKKLGINIVFSFSFDDFNICDNLKTMVMYNLGRRGKQGPLKIMSCYSKQYSLSIHVHWRQGSKSAENGKWSIQQNKPAIICRYFKSHVSSPAPSLGVNYNLTLQTSAFGIMYKLLTL